MNNNKKKETKKKENPRTNEESDMNLSSNSNIDHDENEKDLVSRLDDIKKLASDYYMDDEDISKESDSTDDEEQFFEEDYLDRLTETDEDNTFETIVSASDNLESRLDQIIDDQESKNKEKKSADPTSLSALPAPPRKAENQPVIEKQKNSFSIDEIEHDADELTEQSQTNEDFVDRIANSLNEEMDSLSSLPEKDSIDVFKTYEKDLDSEIIQDMEQEIVNAEKASNPFIFEPDFSDSDDFITNLDKIVIPEAELERSNEKDHQEDMFENETRLSSSSWKDLLDSTDDEYSSANLEVFDFDEEKSFDNFLQEKNGSALKEEPIFPLLTTREEDHKISNEEHQNLQKPPFTEMDDQIDQDTESVESLRKSFIDEFDHTAFEEEIEKKNKKNWFTRNIESFKNWFNSLGVPEKILIFLSFFISLAVIISIVLIVSQWSMNKREIASPPPAIEATDQDLIYPTGLQLPGGWFFFLQRGEIQDNKWEPQNAEWLANTKLRKVIAIPWSNQSETVVQSLTTQDEISIFMNNNDIIVYQVEEVLQISRDNVRILSDTEPSLVVILFREDNEDRWTIIAKPKLSE